MMVVELFCFFFSSRRRHTRSLCDWSSDVCSSDLTEHALFERYAAAARGTGESDTGRVTILVSHRFSTVRMADLIVVLDGARLVEVGTHDELMAKSGQYSQLYSIQASAYP